MDFGTMQVSINDFDNSVKAMIVRIEDSGAGGMDRSVVLCHIFNVLFDSVFAVELFTGYQYGDISL